MLWKVLEYIKCVSNVQGNLQNLAVLSNESKRAILEAKRVAVELVLEQEQKPYRSIPAWQRMQEHHAKIRGRYNFCVVEGDSKAGKTRWAMTATAGDPRQVFYCNCNSVVQPDLRMLDPTVHRVSVFDEAHPIQRRFASIC